MERLLELLKGLYCEEVFSFMDQLESLIFDLTWRQAIAIGLKDSPMRNVVIGIDDGLRFKIPVFVERKLSEGTSILY